MTSQRHLQRVRGYVSEVAEQQGWRQQLDMHSFFPRWHTLFPESISAHTRPLKIISRVLWLETDNSAWMQHLQFQKIHILETINRTLRLGQLEDIRLILAEGKPTVNKPKKAEIYFVPPNPTELKAFEEQAALIEDAAIRESLIRLWYQSHACCRT